MTNRPLLLGLVLIPVVVLLFVLPEPGETGPVSIIAILASGLIGLISPLVQCTKRKPGSFDGHPVCK